MENFSSHASEVGNKASEAKSNFDPDEKVKKEDTPKSDGEPKNSYDPDAKVEKDEGSESGKAEEKTYDPDEKVGQDESSKPEEGSEKSDTPDAKGGKNESSQTTDSGKEDDSSKTDSEGEKPNDAGDGEKKTGLTDEQKEQIKQETGWSDEIIDAIGSMEEYQLYKDAGLVEAEINGKPCLINPNIDMEQKDEFGRTNKERMEQGLAPLDKDGKPIELHHIGQHADSPLAELTQEQHRGKENYSTLHDSSKESEIDRSEFASERSNHWKSRAEGEN